MKTPAAHLQAIAPEIHAELGAITHWWATYAADHGHGGFHGEIDADNAPATAASKGVVLNTRILWFFSEAAFLGDDPRARALADRAADYLTAHFYDPAHHGMMWELNAAGAPIDCKKQAYAQAFAIYALTAHHRATGNAVSLALAQRLFALIEAHYWDGAQGGYIEALSQSWAPLADVRLSNRDANAPKTMNTHLHVLEAYTALHAAAPNMDTHAALARCIGLMLDRFVDPANHHLRLFFDMDWNDRSEAISFGHDIEASWLIWEACEVLGEPALLTRAKPIVLAMARTAMNEALGEDGGVFNERGANGHIDRSRVWWVQAEALVGFLNAYKIEADPAFADAFIRTWRFIQAHHRHPRGEWTWMSELDPTDSGRAYKAGFWKGPYHNGRAMLECSARLKKLL